MERGGLPSSCYPAKLVKLAAQVVTRALVYEDKDCYHYRWDPVNIWQFEIPHKKKKGRKADKDRNVNLHLIDATAHNPQPQWKEMKKFRDWWSECSALGSLDSGMRTAIMGFVEQCSWTSRTQEEDVLFLLLRLCVHIKLEIISDHFEKFSEWCDDLAQVISHLGPFPLQKLYVTHDSLGIQPVLVAIVQQSPNLQVVHVNQWAMNNEFMSSLGSCCSQLTEFSIPLMKPQVFMSDEALFSCFFGGQSSEDVLACWRSGEKPKISFAKLKFVDILYWKQSEKFIQMLALFYPKVRLRSVNVTLRLGDDGCLTRPFQEVNAHPSALTVVFNLNDVVSGDVEEVVNAYPYLKEVRVHVDDSLNYVHNLSVGTTLEKITVEDKLKELLCKMKSWEALAVCPHNEINIMNSLLPALRVRGMCLTSLQLCHEFSPFKFGSLKQLMNLCPRLRYLALSLAPDIAERRTPLDNGPNYELSPCPELQTLVVKNVAGEIYTQYGNQDQLLLPLNDSYIYMVLVILKAASNLKTLGVALIHRFLPYFHFLQSTSVQVVHLEVIPSEPPPPSIFEVPASICDFLVKKCLTLFPNLTNLSMDLPDNDDNIDQELLTCVNRSAVSLTRWRPEFYQDVPAWDVMPPVRRRNFHVM